jgi:hypothetical protein
MSSAKKILERAMYQAAGHPDPAARYGYLVAEIAKAIAALRGPEPDWSEAPETAEWWAVGPNNNARWFTKEPIVASFAGSPLHWFSAHLEKDAGRVTLPLGCDWRLTLRRRPGSEEQA